MVDIKMYMSEISKFKISDLKPQKMTILWTLKHVSAISKHPVLQTMNIRLPANQKEASKYMANDGIDYCYKQEV